MLNDPRIKGKYHLVVVDDDGNQYSIHKSPGDTTEDFEREVAKVHEKCKSKSKSSKTKK